MTRRDGLAYALIALLALLFAAILDTLPGAPFRRFFGSLDPRLALGGVAAAGAVALARLQSQGWFCVIAPGARWRGARSALAAATLFAAVVVPADLLIRFPKDLNVPPPQSLLFYPAIGFVAEVLLHVLPLALLLELGRPLLARVGRVAVLRSSLVATALLEPVLQLQLGGATPLLSAAAVFVLLHVLAFNLVELWIFARHDFVSMLACRLAYYAYWHIIWGQLRLHWLF